MDPVVKCRKCGNQERADHILEDILKEKFEGMSTAQLDKLLKKHRITCEKCKGSLEGVQEINMTFPVTVGTGKAARTAYLTPETAQGVYVNFKLMFDVLRKKLPMGIAVVGKAFRNEISPRNALIRMREFSQAELQIFFDPKEFEVQFSQVAKKKLLVLSGGKVREVACQSLARKLPKWYVFYLAKAQEFFTQVIGFPRACFRLRELKDEEKAFYNRYHWDVELKLGVGWKEVAGVHYRGDYDLSRHEKVSGEKMTVSLDGKKFIPHVLEISMGIDRSVYSLLDIFYREVKGRLVLGVPRHMAPFDAAVFPLVNKDKLPEKAREVSKLLEKEGFTIFSDASGSIGRMYRRIDEIGCPAGITIDYDSLKRGDVTLRDRDSMKQVRVKTKDLPGKLREFLHGKRIESLGRVIK